MSSESSVPIRKRYIKAHPDQFRFAMPAEEIDRYELLTVCGFYDIYRAALEQGEIDLPREVVSFFKLHKARRTQHRGSHEMTQSSTGGVNEALCEITADPLVFRCRWAEAERITGSAAVFDRLGTLAECDVSRGKIRLFEMPIQLESIRLGVPRSLLRRKVFAHEFYHLWSSARGAGDRLGRSEMEWQAIAFADALEPLLPELLPESASDSVRFVPGW